MANLFLLFTLTKVVKKLGNRNDRSYTCSVLPTMRASPHYAVINLAFLLLGNGGIKMPSDSF